MIPRLKLEKPRLASVQGSTRYHLVATWLYIALYASVSLYGVVAFAILEAPTLLVVSASMFCISILCGLIFLRGHYLTARVILLVTGNVVVFTSSLLEPPASNVHMYLVGMIGIPFLIISWRESRSWMISLAALPILLWCILVFTNFAGGRFYEVEVSQVLVIGKINSIILYLAIAIEFATFEYLTRSYATALRQSYRAEVRAGRVKTAFLSSMGHEIRTPLGAVIGAAELLQDHPDATDDIKRLGHMILEGGKTILMVTEKSTRYSQVIGGRTEADISQFTLMPVIQGQIHRLSLAISQKQLKMALHCEDDRPIWGDSGHLGEAIYQVLDNAAKYVQPRGSVTIRVFSGAPGWIKISVVDDGPGIPLEHASRAFEPFNRLMMTHSATPGSGVGLNIAKAYVEAMFGRIEVMAVPNEKSGTHIQIELPTTPPDGIETPDRA